VTRDEIAPWSAAVREFEALGLLREQQGRVALTRRGKLLADSVAEAFV
jgi:oxygen-independent coproporphyrinogen-3 oxidase